MCDREKRKKTWRSNTVWKLASSSPLVHLHIVSMSRRTKGRILGERLGGGRRDAAWRRLSQQQPSEETTLQIHLFCSRLHPGSDCQRVVSGFMSTTSDHWQASCERYQLQLGQDGLQYQLVCSSSCRTVRSELRLAVGVRSAQHTSGWGNTLKYCEELDHWLLDPTPDPSFVPRLVEMVTDLLICGL